jgi:hypothetical protein
MRRATAARASSAVILAAMSGAWSWTSARPARGEAMTACTRRAHGHQEGVHSTAMTRRHRHCRRRGCDSLRLVLELPGLHRVPERDVDGGRPGVHRHGARPSAAAAVCVFCSGLWRYV